MMILTSFLIRARTRKLMTKAARTLHADLLAGRIVQMEILHHHNGITITLAGLDKKGDPWLISRFSWPSARPGVSNGRAPAYIGHGNTFVLGEHRVPLTDAALLVPTFKGLTCTEKNINLNGSPATYFKYTAAP